MMPLVIARGERLLHPSFHRTTLVVGAEGASAQCAIQEVAARACAAYALWCAAAEYARAVRAR